MKKISDYSIETSILLVVILLLGMGFCAGYSFRFVQEKAEKEIPQCNEEYYFVKGGYEMLESLETSSKPQDRIDEFSRRKDLIFNNK